MRAAGWLELPHRVEVRPGVFQGQCRRGTPISSFAFPCLRQSVVVAVAAVLPHLTKYAIFVFALSQPPPWSIIRQMRDD